MDELTSLGKSRRLFQPPKALPQRLRPAITQVRAIRFQRSFTSASQPHLCEERKLNARTSNEQDLHRITQSSKMRVLTRKIHLFENILHSPAGETSFDRRVQLQPSTSHLHLCARSVRMLPSFQWSQQLRSSMQRLRCQTYRQESHRLICPDACLGSRIQNCRPRTSSQDLLLKATCRHQ
jgi:hypothetical protein